MRTLAKKAMFWFIRRHPEVDWFKLAKEFEDKKHEVLENITGKLDAHFDILCEKFTRLQARLNGIRVRRPIRRRPPLFLRGEGA